jgi:hypothetical protein
MCNLFDFVVSNPTHLLVLLIIMKDDGDKGIYESGNVGSVWKSACRI